MKKMLPLILIIVAGAFFAFWYFQIREDKPANTQNNSQDNPVPNPTPPAQTPEEVKVNYFVIPEWGVKFPIEKQYAEDIDYRIFNYNKTVNFGSKKAALLSEECSGENVGINIGLYKSSSNQKEVYSTYTIKLGDYYYHTSEPRMTGCDLENKIDDETDRFVLNLYNNIKEGLKNLEFAQ